MSPRPSPHRPAASRVALALLVLCAVAFAADIPVTPKVPVDPPLLFRVSFDKNVDRADVAVGDADFLPFYTDRSPIWAKQGMKRVEESKDFRKFRSRRGEDGRFGACLKVGRYDAHAFRSLGNASVRRGTVSFWIRFDAPLMRLVSNMFSVEGAPVYLRSRNDTVQVRSPEPPKYPRSVKWTHGRWYHIGVVYDCYRGAKVYVDGKRVKAGAWGKRAHFRFTDRTRNAWAMRFSSGHYTRTPLAKSLDETRIYSVPLAEASIRLLAAGKPLPKGPATEPPVAPGVFRAHRLMDLGWDKPGDLLPIRMGGAPLRLRRIGVLSSRHGSSWSMSAVDGLPCTSWRGVSRFGKPSGCLNLTLDPTARIDYVRLEGNFEGRAYAANVVEQPPAKQAVLTLRNNGRYLRTRLSAPVRRDKLSLWFAQVTGPKRRLRYGDGFINEIAFIQVGKTADSIASAKPRRYHLTAQSFKPADKWTRWRMASAFEPEDRVALALAPRPSGQTIRLQALRHVHLFVPPSSSETPMDGLRLRLGARGLAKPTKLRVEVRNPVDVSRRLITLDFQLQPGGGVGEVLLDMQDVIIPKGRPVWLILTPERDLDIASADTTVDVLTKPKAEALAEHVRNTLNFAKDVFGEASEPRPWSKVAMPVLAERLQLFRWLHLALEDLKRHAPKDDRLIGLWLWTHPKEKVSTASIPIPDTGGAPRWAWLAKECMKKYRAALLWWVENRRMPSGVFGGGAGDDTDLLQDWLSLALICDPDGRLRESVLSLADYCWDRKMLDKGINRRTTDALHAYEEGVNMLPLAAQLDYGSPVRLERLMLSARTTRDLLMYVAPTGQLHFKASYYGSGGPVLEKGGRSQDCLTNALMLHPALYLAYYARNPAALKVLKEWGGGWAGLQHAAFKKSGLKGPFPITARYPSGRIAKTTSRYIGGYGYVSVCQGLYEFTGEERYFTPFRTWMDRKVFAGNEQPNWFALRDMKSYRPGILWHATRINWDYLRPAMGDDPRQTLIWMAWLSTGDRKYVEKALESAWRHIHVLFAMHTWAEQTTDRVALSKTMVDRMYLGGQPGSRNKFWPMHAVSWEGFTPEFAAWVFETKPDRLRLWVYNFEDRPQKGALRVWRLQNGVYEMRVGPDADQDGKFDQPVAPVKRTLAKRSGVPLTLPSRKLCMVELKQARKLAPLWPRPDLAVTTEDMRFDPKKRELRFVVHNVGNAPAVNVKAVVLSGKRKVFETVIPNLEAPNDLKPKSVAITAGSLPPGRLTVVLDPEDRVPEIWEGNNAAVVDVR